MLAIARCPSREVKQSPAARGPSAIGSRWKLPELPRVFVVLSWLVGAALGLSLLAGPARAQDPAEGEERPASQGWLSKVEIHGFGSWAAGETDGNSYLSGEKGREYDTRNFALTVLAQPTEKLTVNFQGFWGNEEGSSESLTTEMDYGFAEWAFSDQLRLRGGVVKHPFGIYTEILHVGTVRPFFSLPQSIYGPAEFIAEAYQGMGITGVVHPGSGWDLQYDVYGGEIEIAGTEAVNPLLFFEDDEEAEGFESGEELEAEEKLKDLLGGRVTFYSPLPGLSFGVSAFRGEPEEEEAEEPGEEQAATTQETYGAHVQYVSSKWELRSEWAHRDGGDEDVEADAFYLEVAYRLDSHWQIAARYDEADRNQENEGDLLARSLLEHQDVAFGVNYWFNSNFVLKLSYHDVEGNLYAVPEIEGDVDDLAELQIDPSTELIEFGLQFSF